MTSGGRARDNVRHTVALWGATALLLLSPPAIAGGGLLLAPLMALAGIFAVIGRPAEMTRALLTPGALMLAAFIAWTSLSASWSPGDNLDNVVKLIAGVPLYAAFAVYAGQAQGRTLNILRAGFVFAGLGAAVMLGFEMATGGALTAAHRDPGTPREVIWLSLGHGASTLVVCLPAFVALVWPGGATARLTAAAMTVMAAISAMFLGISANVLAAVCGAAAALFAWQAPRTTLRAVGWGGAGMIVFSPVMALGASMPEAMRSSLPLSWEMRLDIWRFTAGKILEAPLFGHGFDASRDIHDTLELRGLEFAAIPLHPHNIGLHVWLETGLVGVALIAIAIIACTERVVRSAQLTQRQAVAAAGCTAAVLGVGAVSYGMWQEWWLASVFMAVGGCLLVSRPGLRPAP